MTHTLICPYPEVFPSLWQWPRIHKDGMNWPMTGESNLIWQTFIHSDYMKSKCNVYFMCLRRLIECTWSLSDLTSLFDLAYSRSFSYSILARLFEVLVDANCDSSSAILPLAAKSSALRNFSSFSFSAIHR